MKNKLLIIILIFSFNMGVFAQEGKVKPGIRPASSPANVHIDYSKLKGSLTPGRTFDIPFSPKNLGSVLPSSKMAFIKAYSDTGLPCWIEGVLLSESGINRQDNNATAFNFIKLNQSVLKIENPQEEFVQISKLQDGALNHIKYQQYYKGIQVWNSEISFHLKDGVPYLFNGRFIPTPADVNILPSITLDVATNIAKSIRPIQQFTEEQLKYIGEVPIFGSLVIYTQIEKSIKGQLAYHITAHPNLVSRYEYFIDAHTGKLIDEIKSSCALVHDHKEDNISYKFNSNELHVAREFSMNPPLDGAATANAIDLNGTSRLLNTYLKSGNYYLIDASRPMFNSPNSIPNDPKGAIMTIDAGNKSPENNNFSANHVTSANNTWSSKVAVSAHYNGGIAYDYFRTRFNRNSINGSGGTIISIVNVTESNGSGMDNAFWNGSAMYYGNGNTGFKPLAGALDVAGHEMSHGVIQATANLTYQGESGAMNESFADVFGVLIDRDDYKLGEDVVKLGEFPSGALRDMSDPHNGGNSLNDGGYQPSHMNEKYTGSQDNGGVHINSGILNFAFFKVATRLGKDDAEKLYYAALSKYLTKSSQFIDCRNAVIQAGKDLYGNNSPNIAQIENSFSEVGIGSGGGTTQPPDYGTNPGEDFVIFATSDLSTLGLYQVSNGNIIDLQAPNGVKSKPSVSDDGSSGGFIGADDNMYSITFDWAQGQYNFGLLDDQNAWRNVVISKDGNRLAALLDSEEPYIYVFDLLSQTNESFKLYNPTTGSGGIFTDNVDYADAMEFDHTGEYLMYDALSSLFFAGTEYWDIAFINVWNNSSKNYGNGEIEKLFTSLPDGVSVGNPVFSKNSPNIIAFDYIEDGTPEINQLWGANIETGNIGVIYENNTLAYPCFSKDDKYVIFNSINNGEEVIGVQQLTSSKINPTGSASLLIGDSYWGAWFGTGERVINSNFGLKVLKDKINVYPNPAKNEITLNWSTKNNFSGIIKVLDIKGNVLTTKSIELKEGENSESIRLDNLPAGAYFIEAQRGQLKKTVKFMKN
ncbi:MAG: M4 family metallopeptidase [Saprospiraceae bacterium]